MGGFVDNVGWAGTGGHGGDSVAVVVDAQSREVGSVVGGRLGVADGGARWADRSDNERLSHAEYFYARIFERFWHHFRGFHDASEYVIWEVLAAAVRMIGCWMLR